jgi:hypothetical protein
VPALVTISVEDAPLDPAIVLADVTIRSGRTRADDGLEPASATIDLQVATAPGAGVVIGDALVVDVNGAPRFTGKVAEITRSAVPDDPVASTYTIVAIGALARLPRILVHLPIAPQTAANRAQAVFDAAGIPVRIEGGDTLQIGAYGVDGDDPTTADQVIGSLVTDTGAIVADQGDGAVLVQFLDSRLGHDSFTPDPDRTHVDLAWDQSDDLVNDATVEWIGGLETARDDGSVSEYDLHSIRLTTALADVGSAIRRCNSLVARLARPAWSLGAVQTWDEAALAHNVGALVTIAPLPPSSPVAGAWTGVLEGWTETYSPASDGSGIVGAWDLAIGDLQHSAETLPWIGVDPETLQWAEVNPDTAWIEAVSNGDLQ